MNLNNKGFAISSIMYLILVMALIIIAVLLGLLNNRKMILDKQKKNIIDSVSIKELQPLETIDVSQSEIVIPQTGLYKVELCGASVGTTKGSCTSGLITFQRNQKLYVNIGNSSSSFTDLRLVQNNQYSAIMFAAGGNETYYNSSCDGSFISGHIGCNSVTSSGANTSSPVYDQDFIFSNTEIKTNENSGTGSAKITFISSEKSNQTVFKYDYTNGEQIFTAPRDGYYKLEVWGAQGGEGLCNGMDCYVYDQSRSTPKGLLKAIGGYGGYSTGIVHLSKNDRLYVNVGGKGEDGTLVGCSTNSSNQKKCTGRDSNGGYNGGGLGTHDGHGKTAGDDEVAGGGGGATHIATVLGQLPGLSNAFNQGKVLIIAGGGGGGAWARQGGSGGGIEGGPSGSNGVANQSSGYSFGQGANATGIGDNDGHGGGGGGLYGGLESTVAEGNKEHGGGGSGYIGNSLLLSSSSVTKHMACYSCTTSTATSTKTNSTTDYSENPVTDKPKAGNGYAKITYIGTSLN